MPESPLHALTIDGLTDDIRVLHFEGHEGMSQPFELDVVIGTRATLDFDAIVRKGATLTIGTIDASASAVTRSGIVSRVEQDNRTSMTATYRVTIVPWTWKLEQRVNSRIFQSMTAPAIVKAVFDDAGAASGTDYDISLQGTYAQREYCVQYRESDWDFVSRLLEEEGIFYYFQHTSAGHRIALADAASAYPAIDGAGTLVFRPAVGALASTAEDTYVLRFHFSEEVRPGKITLRDWNFLKPSLLLESTTTASDAGSKDAALEVYDFPGEYADPGDGNALAQVRLDEHGAARVTGGGESTCVRLLPGYTFTLSEHPRDSFNAAYVVTRAEYWGTDPEALSREDRERESQPWYSTRFQLLPATVLFRPPRISRRPHIHGVQTATVVGPSGEEIYVDANLRVKVQFHWDRLGKNDDKSSCWVRVAQTWGSAAFGAMFIPRIKDEVVVTFLEGNPDDPLIVGSVYTATNVPPYTLPDDKTKSTIKSNSTPGGGGFNELRFEDKKGSEEVFLQAQKDWTINVLNDKNQKVGHDETHEVDNDRTKTVKHDQTTTIQHDDTWTVQHDQTGTVQNDQSLTVQNDRSVTVQNDHTESVSGKQSITVTGAQSLTLQDKQDIAITGKRTLTVNDDVTETYKAKLSQTVSSDVSQTLQGKRTVNVSSDDAETIGGKQTVSITGDMAETVSGKKTMTVTGNVTITSGSSTVTIKPSGEISIQGTNITIDSSGPLKVHGATVDVKSDGPTTVTAPMIKTSADAMNTVKGSVVVLDGSMINVG